MEFQASAIIAYAVPPEKPSGIRTSEFIYVTMWQSRPVSCCLKSDGVFGNHSHRQSPGEGDCDTEYSFAIERFIVIN